MAIEKIGIDFEGIQNISQIDFNVTNLTANEFINEIPRQANSITDGLYGIIVLLILSVFLFIVLSERNQFTEFQYSVIRALGLALGTCCVFGALLLQIGYMTSYLHFIYLNSLFLLILSWIILKNPE